MPVESSTGARAIAAQLKQVVSEKLDRVAESKKVQLIVSAFSDNADLLWEAACKANPEKLMEERKQLVHEIEQHVFTTEWGSKLKSITDSSRRKYQRMLRCIGKQYDPVTGGYRRIRLPCGVFAPLPSRNASHKKVDDFDKEWALKKLHIQVDQLESLVSDGKAYVAACRTNVAQLVRMRIEELRKAGAIDVTQPIFVSADSVSFYPRLLIFIFCCCETHAI